MQIHGCTNGNQKNALIHTDTNSNVRYKQADMGNFNLEKGIFLSLAIKVLAETYEEDLSR